MGFMENVAQKAREAKDEKFAKKREEVEKFLVPGEEITGLFTIRNDYAAITTKRILFIDKTYLSKKMAVISAPLHQVTVAALLRGGLLSFTTEVELRVGMADYMLVFSNADDALNFYKAIIAATCPN